MFQLTALVFTLVVMWSSSVEAGVAQGNIAVVPSSITADDMRNGATVQLLFPGGTLDTTRVRKWRQHVRIATVVTRSDRPEPHGYDGYVRELCDDDECISVTNASTIIRLDFGKAPFFGLVSTQTMRVGIDIALLPRSANSAAVTFEITPDGTEPSLIGAAGVAALFLIRAGTGVSMPSTMDASLLLAANTNCVRGAEREWLPYSQYGLIPMYGPAPFDAAWRLVLAAIVIAAIAAAVFRFLQRRSSSSSNSSDYTGRLNAIALALPFVMQAVLSFGVPGAAFAAGVMISSPSAAQQVVATTVCAITVAILIPVFMWLHGPQWQWVKTPPARLRRLGHFERFVAPLGLWLPTTVPRSMVGEGRPLPVFPHPWLPRETGPAVRHFVFRFAVLGHWYVSALEGFAAGLSLHTPAACLGRGVFLLGLHTTHATFIVYANVFRSRTVGGLSALIHLTAGLTHAMLVLNPESWKQWAMALAVVTTVAAQIARLVVNVYTARMDQQWLQRELAVERVQSEDRRRAPRSLPQ